MRTLEKADEVLIGGGMTYILQSSGIEIPVTPLVENRISVAKSLLEKSNGKLICQLTQKEANAFADYTEVKDTKVKAVDRFPWFGYRS